MKTFKIIAALAAFAFAASAVTTVQAAPRGAPSSVPRGSPGHDGPGERPNGDHHGNGNRINVGNDVDIDIDTDPDWDHGHRRHPVATAVAVGAVVSIGTRVYVLPTGCTTSYYAGVSYSYCGSTWYRPYYQGSTITYVVVVRPY